MIGKVLFCEENSYKDTQGVQHDGYRLGVVFKWYDETRCCESWSAVPTSFGGLVDVQWSKKYQKFFVHVPDLSSLPDMP